MEYYIKTVALLASLLVGANFLIYLIANIRNRFENDLERNSLIFWGSLIPLFIIGANLEDLIYTPFVTIFAIFTFVGIRKLIFGDHYKVGRERLVLLTSFILFFISAWYFYETRNIIPSAIMISTGLNLYLLEGIYTCIVELKNKNIYHKMILICLFIGLYNNCAPILGQIDPSFDFIGWTTALLMYQMMSIVLPLIILEKRKEQEKENLAHEIKIKTQGLILEKSQLSHRHQEASFLAKENMSLLNTLSHDIANPILVISLLIHQLKKLPLDEKTIDHVGKIETSIKTVIDFINVSKTQRKLVAKKKILELEQINIQHCIQECRLLSMVFLRKKAILLTINNTLTKDQTFLANESTFILSILNNILSNAIKFTPQQGTIDLNINEFEGQIVIEIQDSGEGIDKKTLNDINMNGFTTSTTGTDGEEGSGFGISNVIRYVKQYNGDIKFSTNTTGTNVRMMFPLAEAEEAMEDVIANSLHYLTIEEQTADTHSPLH